MKKVSRVEKEGNVRISAEDAAEFRFEKGRFVTIFGQANTYFIEFHSSRVGGSYEIACKGKSLIIPTMRLFRHNHARYGTIPYKTGTVEVRFAHSHTPSDTNHSSRGVMMSLKRT